MRVKRLFDEIADLSATARARYFAANQISSDTRREVEDLLSFDGGSMTAVERQLSRIAAAALDGAEETGRCCGPYRLGLPLGQGGMGVVYAAERVDGEVTRKVAVKLLRMGADAPAIRKRFLAERQILASLSHPGIAALVDAGHTSDGQPYLVMDYIEGVAIDAYSRNLDLRSTLQLFVRVCDAVSYAHQKLVVHRDIKPSNILVDKSGQPKLLDFGIAKLLEDDNLSAALLTREGGAVLTPAYAAPEQISGGQVTTATDVYALGVLLFVLLTGQHPAGAAPQSYAEAYKAALETEPRRVSAVRPRERFRSPFRADLDTIVAKALKKNSRDRYASVAALAGDVGRYLNHEPIKARPDTLAYRSAKFVRRHRVPVVFASLAVIASIAGVAGTLNQARTARIQRDFALRQLSRAEAINDLNSYVLSDAAPSGKLFSVDDLLARSENIVRHQRRKDDVTRIDLLISIGRQYTVQDEYAKARALLEESYRLSRGISDPSTRGRAACALAQTLSRVGELSRAESLFQEGIKGLPEQPLQVLDRIFCLERGAEVAVNGGDAKTALTRAQAARSLVNALPIASELTELNTLITLAGAQSAAGRFQEAARGFETASARLGQLGRGDTQRSGTVFNNWGVALMRAGRPLEAAAALRRSIEISMTGETEDSVQAMPLVNYGRALFDVGRTSDAQKYVERGLAKAKQIGDEVPLRQGLLLLAGIYRANGELQLADRTVSEAARRFEQGLPAGHPLFAGLALERALNAESAGDLKTAWKYANEAAALLDESSRGCGAHRLPRFLIYRSGVALRLGRVGAAQTDAVRALRILRDGDRTEAHSETFGRAYLALGRALDAQDRQTEARAAFSTSAEHLRSALGPDHPDSRSARELGIDGTYGIHMARRLPASTLSALPSSR